MRNNKGYNQMRGLLNSIRNNEKYVEEQKNENNPKNDVRHLLKIMRNHLSENSDIFFLKENNKNTDTEDVVDVENKKNFYDEKWQQQDIIKYFDGDVYFDFGKLEITDNWVLWSGIVNGVVVFVYKVTRNELTSGAEFDYLVDMPEDNPQNDELIRKLQVYFDTVFSKYWRNNLLQKTKK